MAAGKHAIEFNVITGTTVVSVPNVTGKRRGDRQSRDGGSEKKLFHFSVPFGATLDRIGTALPARSRQSAANSCHLRIVRERNSPLTRPIHGL
jgi:hypothetical protein